MRSKFAVSILVAGALTAWLSSRPVHASTSMTSFAVTATVEAGCNVSPGTAPLQNSGSGQLSSTPTASVNCSLPVSYQIVADRVSGNGNGAAGLSRTESASVSGNANSRSSDVLKVWSLPYGVSTLMEEPESTLQELSFLDSDAGSIDAAGCSLFGAPPETVTLTIIY
jgi:hypothetical protein